LLATKSEFCEECFNRPKDPEFDEYKKRASEMEKTFNKKYGNLSGSNQELADIKRAYWNTVIKQSNATFYTIPPFEYTFFVHNKPEIINIDTYGLYV
jgi:hypothetical protein